MPETQADIGYGTYLKKGNGGTPSETFTDMGLEITSISLPSYSRDAIDASHMASPDQFREYVAGLMDAGEITVEMNYYPDDEDAVIAALLGGKANYQMGNSDWGVTFTFAAICTAYSPTAPVDDKMTASATFKISGKPTLEAVSS